jgi:hypothetical protein
VLGEDEAGSIRDGHFRVEVRAKLADLLSVRSKHDLFIERSSSLWSQLCSLYYSLPILAECSPHGTPLTLDVSSVSHGDAVLVLDEQSHESLQQSQ